LSDVLALELEPFGGHVRVVIPGSAPESLLSATARAKSQNGIPPAHAEWAKKIFPAPKQSSEVTTARDVAEAVWKAATDPSAPARIPAGADAIALAGGD
jgi:hypothetical protein